jgi:hypothetical protein
LAKFLDIHVTTDLYLEYQDVERWHERHLVSCRVRNVKEVDDEKKEKWLTETFNAGLRLTPIEFLEVFKSVNMKYTSTARVLLDRVKPDLGPKPERVKKLIFKLYEDFPGLYDQVLDKPPNGVHSRPKKILKFER